MTSISVSRLHFPVTTLGPGRRIGIWMQGCSIRCQGCISPDTWAPGLGNTSVTEVLDVIQPWLAEADGLTVSGGEPFDQRPALGVLLDGWRRLHHGDVLVFTGHDFEVVRSWLSDFDGLIDALIAGPFDASQPQTLALRGSDNQTLHVLTSRGAHFQRFERLADDRDRLLDVMFDQEGGAWFAGIPARGDFQRLYRLLRSEGHVVTTASKYRGRPQ